MPRFAVQQSTTRAAPTRHFAFRGGRYNPVMPSIMVSVVRQDTSYTLRFDDAASDHTKNCAYHDLSKQVLTAKLRELCLSDEDIQKIISRTAQSIFQGHHQVDEATYRRVLRLE
jgi:hypothetical protein